MTHVSNDININKGMEHSMAMDMDKINSKRTDMGMDMDSISSINSIKDVTMDAHNLGMIMDVRCINNLNMGMEHRNMVHSSVDMNHYRGDMDHNRDMDVINDGMIVVSTVHGIMLCGYVQHVIKRDV